VNLKGPSVRVSHCGKRGTSLMKGRRFRFRTRHPVSESALQAKVRRYVARYSASSKFMKKTFYLLEFLINNNQFICLLIIFNPLINLFLFQKS
jgi:hypothetical protein